MLGSPPLPPRGSPVADRPTRRPPRFASTKGGGGVPSPPPPYSPQNCRTPLGVTHWLAAAPVVCICTWVVKNFFLVYGPPSPWRGSRVPTLGIPSRPPPYGPLPVRTFFHAG